MDKNWLGGFAALILSVFMCSSCAQSGGLPVLGPKGQTAVVSLTYDDAVPVHRDLVAPLLNRHGMTATFYLTVKFIDSASSWAPVAQAGHELGNHSLFHPCRREPETSYGWLPEHYDLAKYDLNRFRDELTVANKAIDLIDGGKSRTYGNTCLNEFVGSGAQKTSIAPVIKQSFIGARGHLTEQPIFPGSANYLSLGHFSGDGKTFEAIKGEIERAIEKGGWVIYMFHGVGEGSHTLFIDEQEHTKLIEWLASRKDIWVAPVADVASRFKQIGSRSAAASKPPKS